MDRQHSSCRPVKSSAASAAATTSIVMQRTMALLLMQPMLNICEGTIQAIISRGPVPYLSRKVTMPAKKLIQGSLLSNYTLVRAALQ
jgi:hypothetical protein